MFHVIQQMGIVLLVFLSVVKPHVFTNFIITLKRFGWKETLLEHSLQLWHSAGYLGCLCSVHDDRPELEI